MNKGGCVRRGKRGRREERKSEGRRQGEGGRV